MQATAYNNACLNKNVYTPEWDKLTLMNSGYVFTVNIA